MKIKLTPYNEQTKINLDELLDDNNVSATDISGTNFSATKPRSVTTSRSSTTECSSTTIRSDTTETQRVNKWRTKTKDTIRFDVEKGTKSFLMNEASKRGMSLTQMIKESVKLYLSTY